jgi:hypothetical protein
VSGIVIDDSNYGTTHAWSPNRIVKEITDLISNSELSASLSRLNDVNISSPSNEQVLMYNSTTNKWEAKTISLKTKLSELTDVDLSSLFNNYFLKYQSDINKFKALPLKMEDISDLDRTNLGNDYIIKYDSNTKKFKTSPLPKLRELSDVNPNGIIDRSIIQYSLAEDKFKIVPMFRLQDLRNIDITGIEDGFILYFDQTTNTFKFKEIDAKAKLGELIDVDTSNLEDKGVIIYNESSGKYEAKRINIEDLGNVDIEGIKDNYTLRYDVNKGRFVPTPFLGGGNGDVIYKDITQNLYDYSLNINYTEQVTKLGVIADKNSPKEVDITIPFTNDFNLGKVEVLKYQKGQSLVKNIASFNNGDSTDFIYNSDSVLFDGTMTLVKDKTESSVERTDLGTGEKIFKFSIDRTNIRKIDNIMIK